MHPAGPFQKADGSARLQWDLPRSRWQNLVARPFGWLEERQKPASYKSTDLPIQNCSQSHLFAYAGAHTREICLPSVPQRTLETYPIRGDLCADFLWKARLATRAPWDSLRSTCCGKFQTARCPGSCPLSGPQPGYRGTGRRHCDWPQQRSSNVRLPYNHRASFRTPNPWPPTTLLNPPSAKLGSSISSGSCSRTAPEARSASRIWSPPQARG